MDNEKNVEVSTKTSIATQLATGIAILALVTAGSGLIAFLATPRLGNQINYLSGGSPSSFSLLSPANGAVDQDDSVTLTWEQSTELQTVQRIIKASPTWSFIKPAKATHATMTYEVHFGPTATGTVNVAQVTSRSYTATNLLPGTEYTWRIVARTGHGTKASNETWTFTTAGADWLIGEGYVPVPVGEGAACGGNRSCDDIGSDDADGLGGFLVDNFSCSEWGEVWLTCSGTTNKCPDNLEGQCLQQSICQCNGIPPGSEACTDFMATFTDPCSI